MTLDLFFLIRRAIYAFLEKRNKGEAKGCLVFLQTPFSRAETCALPLCAFSGWALFELLRVGVVVSIWHELFGIKLGGLGRKK